MNDKLLREAEKLAALPYSITVEKDKLSNGQVVFLARHPELPGCKAQGSTIVDAKRNLDEARIDYIYTLLDSEMDVPKPLAAVPTPMSKSAQNAQMWVVDASDDGGVNAAVARIVQPQQREQVYGVSLQGDLVKHG